MKNFLLIFISSLLISSCALFTPQPDFSKGMSESKFLRENRNAVISSIEGDFKTYRVNRDDRFYVLATFQDGELVRLEEKELVPAPAWVPAQPKDENRNKNNE